VFNAEQAYRRLLVLSLALLALLAPNYVQASLSHRTSLSFPDRAQHAERHDLSSAQRDQDLTSNPNPTQRVGARDGGKAAAERRWVGASPERTEYEWDGRDKLRAVRKPDGTRLDYSYDVFGRRVSKTRSGGPLDAKRVEYVWDGEVLAWELDSEKGPRTFVHEPGSFAPILQQQGGETYLCVNDHLGMPKELIDGEGDLAWAAAHGAYGAVIATEGPNDVAVDGGFVQSDGPRVESPFRLLGQVHDEDAELSWTRFRCFEADTGTWISTDPLEVYGGLNLYGLDGSPSDVVDPLGLMARKPHKGKPINFGEGFTADSETFHRDIKPDILASAGAAEDIVGRNPDVRVVGGKIQLRGTGPFKGNSVTTDLDAGDFFGGD
jgi:RHS repeat-associated protein